MAAANTSNDPVAKAKQALAEAERVLEDAKRNRSTTVAGAQHSLATAIAVLGAVQDTTASTVVKARYTDNVANAEQQIATVTAQCDEQVERAENAVKIAKEALYWVVQSTLKGIRLMQEYRYKHTIFLNIITTTNHKAEAAKLKCKYDDQLAKLKCEYDAQLAELMQTQATMDAQEDKMTREHDAATEAQRINLEGLLKQLELD